MFIRSERLFLRPPWPEEFNQLQALIHGDGEGYNAGLVRSFMDVAQARPCVERWQGKVLPRFAVTAPDDRGLQPIGFCGLYREGGEVALAFWIDGAFRRRGYATEAARAALEIARMLGYSRIVSAHFVANPAPAGVLVRAGFTPAGDAVSRFNPVIGQEALVRNYLWECRGFNTEGTRVAA